MQFFPLYHNDPLRYCDPTVVSAIAATKDDLCQPDEEYQIVLWLYGEDLLERLADEDPTAYRDLFLEGLAREGAAEMCTEGKYRKETFIKMASLATSDFKLVTKRILELVSEATDVSNQAVNVGVAGL